MEKTVLLYKQGKDDDSRYPKEMGIMTRRRRAVLSTDTTECKPPSADLDLFS
jgi:hypothetical protein